MHATAGAILLGALFGVSGVAGLPAEELFPGIVNGSFELCTEDGGTTPCASGAGGMPDGWSAHPGDPPNVRGWQSWTTERARTGSASFYGRDPAHAYWYTGASANTPVVPGVSYELTAWVLGGPASTVETRLYPHLNIYDADGALVHQTFHLFGPLSQEEWRETKLRADAPAGAASAVVLLYTSAAPASWGRGGVGDYYVDDVTLLPVLADLPVR